MDLLVTNSDLPPNPPFFCFGFVSSHFHPRVFSIFIGLCDCVLCAFFCMIIRKGVGDFCLVCYEGWPLMHLFSIFRLASFFFLSGSPFFGGKVSRLGYGDLLAVFGDDGFLFCCNSKPITRKIWTYREAFSRKVTCGWETIKNIRSYN